MATNSNNKNNIDCAYCAASQRDCHCETTYKSRAVDVMYFWMECLRDRGDLSRLEMNKLYKLHALSPDKFDELVDDLAEMGKNHPLTDEFWECLERGLEGIQRILRV